VEPAGRPLQLRVRAWLKPPDETTERVTVLLSPGITANVAGFAEREKSEMVRIPGVTLRE
jgi:hypothetical protein